MTVEVEVPQVRVCPDQEDDFLAANPVLLDWGWEPGRDSIVFHALGKIRIDLTRPILPWSDGGVQFRTLAPPVSRVGGEGDCELEALTTFSYIAALLYVAGIGLAVYGGMGLIATSREEEV